MCVKFTDSVVCRADVAKRGVTNIWLTDRSWSRRRNRAMYIALKDTGVFLIVFNGDSVDLAEHANGCMIDGVCAIERNVYGHDTPVRKCSASSIRQGDGV